MSHFLHKVKEAVTGEKHSDDTSSTNAGAYSSNVSNQDDSRVDSSDAYGSGSTNYGPYDSNPANKADSRVDSDRDSRGATGGYGSSTGYGSNTGSGSNTGTGYGSNTGTGYGSNTGTGYGSSTGTGYGSSTGTGYGSNTGYRSSETYGSSNTYGSGSTYDSHDSNVANKLDPRVDSDQDNRARHKNFGGGGSLGSSGYDTQGSGNVHRTGGLYNSDIVRDDSDNSRTFGDVTNY